MICVKFVYKLSTYMVRFPSIITALLLVFTLLGSPAWACGDLKAQFETEAAAAAVATHQTGAVCPATAKACPSTCPGMNQQATQPSVKTGGVQVIVASQRQAGSSCSAGSQSCNMSNVLAALSIGLFIVLGSFTLVSKLKM
jgi:hypothetical protein